MWDDGCGGCSKCGSCNPGSGCALSDSDSLFDDVLVYCTEKFADCCEGPKLRHYTSDLAEEIDCEEGCYPGTTSGCGFTSKAYTCHAEPVCSKTQCNAECESDSDCPSGFACDTSTCRCGSTCTAGCLDGTWRDLAPIDSQTYVGWFYTCVNSTTPNYNQYFGRISTCDYNSYKFQLGLGETLTGGVLTIQGNNPSSYAGICVTQDRFHGLKGWAGFCGDPRIGGCGGFAGMDSVTEEGEENSEVSVVFSTGNYNKGTDAEGNAIAAISVGETKGPFKHYAFRSFLGCVQTSTTSTTTSLTGSTTVPTTTSLPITTSQPGPGTTSIPTTTVIPATTSVPTTTLPTTTTVSPVTTTSTSTTSTTTVPGASIVSVEIPESNKPVHHTDKYKNQNIVLRRGASFTAKVTVKHYSEGTHKLILKMGSPDGGSLEPSIQATAGYDSWGFICSVSSTNPPNTVFNCRVDIKSSAKIGLYNLKAELLTYSGGVTTLISSKAGPGFYVIFNPWSPSDSDVYYANTGELGHYVLGDVGFNYYSGPPIFLGGRVDYRLQQFHDQIFTKAVATVSDQTSGLSSANMIREMVGDIMFYNHCERYWTEGECSARPGCQAVDTTPHCGKKPRTNDPGASQCFSYNQQDCNAKNYCVWATKLCQYRPNSFNYLSTLAIDPGAPAEPGQCMDFANFLVAYLRAVGIPSRPITTILVDSWNFHDWAEARLPLAISGDKWGLMDSTPGYDMNAVRPSSVWKDGQRPYEPDQDAAKVYSYDASVGAHPSDLKCVHYESCAGPSPQNTLNESCPLTIFVSADNVSIGVNASINYGFLNPSGEDVSFTYNLTVVHYSDAFQGDRSNETFTVLYLNDSVNISVNESLNLTETLMNTHLIGTGYNIVSLEANNSCGNESSFNIISGVNITVSSPSTVPVNESLNVTVTVVNTLPSNASNITISLVYPSLVNVSPDTDLTIPDLCTGCANNSVYTVFISSAGTYPIGAQAYSTKTGFAQTIREITAYEPGRVIASITAPPLVSNGSSFTVNATLVNVGGLNVSSTSVHLNWTSGFSSTENLSSPILLLDAGENKTVFWNVTATEVGVHSLSALADNSTASLSNASTLVIVYEGNHNLSVNSTVSEIYNNKTSHTLNIIVSNNNDLDETLAFNLHANPRSILFFVYYNGTSITGNQSLTVPANSSLILVLNASTTGGVSGNITVHMYSALDPSTEALVQIQVTTPVQIRSIPLSDSWNLISLPLRPV